MGYGKDEGKWKDLIDFERGQVEFRGYWYSFEFIEECYKRIEKKLAERRRKGIKETERDK